MSFSDNITKIALSCTTGAEATHFCFYALHAANEVAKVTEDPTEMAIAQAIIPVAGYWNEFGLYEDQLAPAIAILRVLSAFDFGKDLAEPLIKAHAALLESGADVDDIEYSAYYLEKIVPILKESAK
ncbi:hypothetical protein [Citrobacter sp.]|uniref:hypothetical protein n=1 Tax=Citrobacter sp. TaxID=1896336 RepID=UPI002FC6F147